MPITPRQLIDYKLNGQKIVVVTAWDFAIAQILDRSGVDVVLVGDSLAMVALGYDTTIPLSLEGMIHHGQAVRRGVKKALLVVDLPFLTYQVSPEQALINAGRIIQETGAQGVKLEGGNPRMVDTIDRLVQSGIPVMGHVGLTPQSVHHLGYRQQGKTEKEQNRIMDEAIALEQAGVFAVVLEHIPATLAATITSKLTVPTIGIGAGGKCDGQVLVTADLLGMSTYSPPFAKTYSNLAEIITNAVKTYGDEVRQGIFPDES